MGGGGAWWGGGRGGGVWWGRGQHRGSDAAARLSLLNDPSSVMSSSVGRGRRSGGAGGGGGGAGAAPAWRRGGSPPVRTSREGRLRKRRERALGCIFPIGVAKENAMEATRAVVICARERAAEGDAEKHAEMIDHIGSAAARRQQRAIAPTDQVDDVADRRRGRRATDVAGRSIGNRRPRRRRRRRRPPAFEHVPESPAAEEVAEVEVAMVAVVVAVAVAARRRSRRRSAMSPAWLRRLFSARMVHHATPCRAPAEGNGVEMDVWIGAGGPKRACFFVPRSQIARACNSLLRERPSEAAPTQALAKEIA